MHCKLTKQDEIASAIAAANQMLQAKLQAPG